MNQFDPVQLIRERGINPQDFIHDRNHDVKGLLGTLNNLRNQRNALQPPSVSTFDYGANEQGSWGGNPESHNHDWLSNIKEIIGIPSGKAQGSTGDQVRAARSAQDSYEGAKRGYEAGGRSILEQMLDQLGQASSVAGSVGDSKHQKQADRRRAAIERRLGR